MNNPSQDPTTDQAVSNVKAGLDVKEREGPALDLASLGELIGDDQRQQLQLLQFFNMNAPAALREFNDVREIRSCPKMGMAAHKLRSSALSVCASGLAGVCLSLETAARKEAWDEIELMVPLLEAELSRVRDYIETFGNSQPAPSESLLSRSCDSLPIEELGVLLIDDDPQVLMLAQLQLTQIGVEKVIVKDSADKALAYVQEQACGINVVFCDLNMPDKDGLEFIRLLSETEFDGGLVLVSAEDEAVLSLAGRLARDYGLQVLGALTKPLRKDKVEHLLRALGPAQRVNAIKTMPVAPLEKDDLEHALAHGEIVAHFQPKICLSTLKPKGLEALVRWEHPERGLIPPVAFLPIAERHRLMELITTRMLEQAMESLTSMREDQLDLGVAVNIPACVLSDLAWPDYMADLATRSNIPPGKITLEVTETGLVADTKKAVEILTRARLKGFQLSIDDFGTGYSSLEQLLLAPFTELKLDRGFVRGAMTDSSAAAILESSIALAKRLNLQIVAEGVETRDELNMVTRMGCDHVQGYFIGKPMAYKDLRRWLFEWPDRVLAMRAENAER